MTIKELVEHLGDTARVVKMSERDSKSSELKQAWFVSMGPRGVWDVTTVDGAGYCFTPQTSAGEHALSRILKPLQVKQ